MLTNPLPHNENMNSKSHDQSGYDHDPAESSVRGCINMVRATKVVTRVKDYGSSQPSPGKEPNPPGSPLHIEKPMDKPETTPHIPKGVLKHSGHNPNSQATQNYSVVKDLGHTLCAMSGSKYFKVVLCKGRICFLLLMLTMITLPLSSNLKP